MHADRLVTFYKAARRADRLLAVDHYAGLVLHLVSGQARIPRANVKAGIHVFLPGHQHAIEKVERRFADSLITVDEIRAHPKDFVMLFRPPMIETDFGGQLPKCVRCLYSYWSGYLEKAYWQKARANVAEAEGDFLPRHSSGHIHAADLVRFVQTIQPRLVIPIHTTHPARFKTHFSNALLLKDGEAVEV